jgi:hypothetical protein
MDAEDALQREAEVEESDPIKRPSRLASEQSGCG